MPYIQDTRNCFSESIGPNGLEASEFASYLDAAKDGVRRLTALARAGDMALLDVPAKRDDLDRLSVLAERLGEICDDIVVLGIGGSSLGGQALCALNGHGPRRVHFWENLEASSPGDLLGEKRLERTAFIVISKSGRTPEPLAQALMVIAALKENLGADRVAERMIVITEPCDNPLRRLAQRWNMEILDHPADIGGRYSVLTLVGLFPALLAGLDVRKVREGALSVLESIEGEEAAAPVVGAALIAALQQHRSYASAVMMPYSSKLERFTHWYRQLWAESTGKDGQGLTPITALGPVDQHSQLQLWLDGPTDKFFTLIITPVGGNGPGIDMALAGHDPDLAYLAGSRVGDLVEAEARATAETLVRHGRPIRIIRLSRLDEWSMGALFMHFMIETILAAEILGVDPFDQPAVEEGKHLTRRFLEEGKERRADGEALP